MRTEARSRVVGSVGAGLRDRHESIAYYDTGPRVFLDNTRHIPANPTMYQCYCLIISLLRTNYRIDNPDLNRGKQQLEEGPATRGIVQRGRSAMGFRHRPNKRQAQAPAPLGTAGVSAI